MDAADLDHDIAAAASVLDDMNEAVVRCEEVSRGLANITVIADAMRVENEECCRALQLSANMWSHILAKFQRLKAEFQSEEVDVADEDDADHWKQGGQG